MDMLSGAHDTITSCLCDVFGVSRNIQRNSVKANYIGKPLHAVCLIYLITCTCIFVFDFISH